MGDSGSLFSGFLLASLSITGVMKTATLAILLPFVVLAVPIIDITFSTLRRILKGHSPFVADAEHIHHKLLKAGLSQNKTVVTITFVAIVGGAIATSLVGSIGHYLIYMLVLLLIMFGLSLIAITRKKNINPEQILEEEQHKNEEQ